MPQLLISKLLVLFIIISIGLSTQALKAAEEGEDDFIIDELSLQTGLEDTNQNTIQDTEGTDEEDDFVIDESSLKVEGSYVNLSENSEPKAFQTDKDIDPYRSFNEVMFNFNLKAYKYVLIPSADLYEALTPQFARTGINNFFINLERPVSAIYNLLQFKVADSMLDIMSFLFNTTFGLFGLIDLTGAAEIPYDKGTLGGVLYRYGWTQSNYLVLPFLGPTVVRDAVTVVPSYVYDNDLIKGCEIKLCLKDARTSKNSSEQIGRITLNVIRQVDSLKFLLKQLDKLPNPYVFTRTAYLNQLKKRYKK